MYSGGNWLSAPAKEPTRYGESLPTVSFSLFLYLASPLRVESSLAFQKSYLYESCIAGTLVSLSLLGYETGTIQPPQDPVQSCLKTFPIPQIHKTYSVIVVQKRM